MSDNSVWDGRAANVECHGVVVNGVQQWDETILERNSFGNDAIQNIGSRKPQQEHCNW